MNRVRHILNLYLSYMRFALFSAIFGSAVYGIYKAVVSEKPAWAILGGLCASAVGLIAYFIFVDGAARRRRRLSRDILSGTLAAGLRDREKQKQASLIELARTAERLNQTLVVTGLDFQREYSQRYREAPNGQPFTLESEHRLARLFRIAGAIVMILDILISSFLSSAGLELSPMAAILTGGTMAVLLAFLSKSAIYVLSRNYDYNSPESARRRLKVINIVAFVGNGLLIVVLVLGRFAFRDSEVVNSIVGLCLALLGAFLPILAGAVLAFANDLDWSFMYNKNFQRIRLQLAEVEELKQRWRELEQDLTKTNIENG